MKRKLTQQDFQTVIATIGSKANNFAKRAKLTKREILELAYVGTCGILNDLNNMLEEPGIAEKKEDVICNSMDALLFKKNVLAKLIDNYKGDQSNGQRRNKKND